VPVVPGEGSQAAVALACRLAAERHAALTALAVVEVPPELPLEAHMHEADRRASRLSADAQAVGELFGVTVTPRIVRARAAGEAIVEEAAAGESEIVVLAAPQRGRSSLRSHFGETVAFVLRHAPCRVLVVSAGSGA
jgi:nucleotide-binding universal stress UspA family protein